MVAFQVPEGVFVSAAMVLLVGVAPRIAPYLHREGPVKEKGPAE
jgi:hypothetical protein